MTFADLTRLFVVALPAVFFVVDPIGTVPVFLAMTAGDEPSKMRSMAKRACLVAGGLLAFFAIFGGLVFQVFGVTLSAFKVAGGVLLLITSVDMLRARRSATRSTDEETQEGVLKEDVAIVPLALPLLSGPGAIATVMVLMSRGKGLWTAVPVLLSIAITFAASYALLRGAAMVQRFLGRTGIAILERVMGLLLAAIAVQFMADGAQELLQSR